MEVSGRLNSNATYSKHKEHSNCPCVTLQRASLSTSLLSLVSLFACDQELAHYEGPCKNKLLGTQTEAETSLSSRLALLVYLLPISIFDADAVPQQSSNYPMVKSVLKHSQKLELLYPTYLMNKAKGEGVFPVYLNLYKIGTGYETCHQSALCYADLCLTMASLPKPNMPSQLARCRIRLCHDLDK